jgi:hypothetical protein
MTFANWLNLAQAGFPLLNDNNSRLTSPVDDAYNCIAWAAEDTERWWWPDPQEQQFWPASVPRAETVDAFVQAYGLLGYSHTTDASLEPGTQKIAIFANERGAPTHASRQLSDGWWTSKLGEQIDIAHELSAIEGPAYGKVTIVLARIANS